MRAFPEDIVIPSLVPLETHGTALAFEGTSYCLGLCRHIAQSWPRKAHRTALALEYALQSLDHKPGKKWTVGITVPSWMSSLNTPKYSSALQNPATPFSNSRLHHIPILAPSSDSMDICITCHPETPSSGKSGVCITFPFHNNSQAIHNEQNRTKVPRVTQNTMLM